MKNWIIGVDEAGRGPLAGPVAVGVAMVPRDFSWEQLPEVNDSKKLTERKREEIYVVAKKLQKEGKLDFAVSMVSAKMIDRIGIVLSVNLAMDRALKKITEAGPMFDIGPASVRVLLDGGLKAPERFVDQETIIKGDSKEKVIGLASIMAKVTRDRYMRRRAKLAAFEPYDFPTHKGYGTKMHREAIKAYGLSSEHRATFCTNIIS